MDSVGAPFSIQFHRELDWIPCFAYVVFEWEKNAAGLHLDSPPFDNERSYDLPTTSILRNAIVLRNLDHAHM